MVLVYSFERKESLLSYAKAFFFFARISSMKKNFYTDHYFLFYEISKVRFQFYFIKTQILSQQMYFVFLKMKWENGGFKAVSM